jgi:hypothetical protein
MFSLPVKINFKGKKEIPSHTGAITSLFIYTILTFFAVHKGKEFILREKPLISLTGFDDIFN